MSNNLESYLTGKGLEKYLQEIEKLEGKEYADAYQKILPFVKARAKESEKEKAKQADGKKEITVSISDIANADDPIVKYFFAAQILGIQTDSNDKETTLKDKIVLALQES